MEVARSHGAYAAFSLVCQSHSNGFQGELPQGTKWRRSQSPTPTTAHSTTSTNTLLFVTVDPLSCHHSSVPHCQEAEAHIIDELSFDDPAFKGSLLVLDVLENFNEDYADFSFSKIQEEAASEENTRWPCQGPTRRSIISISIYLAPFSRRVAEAAQLLMLD